MFLFNLSDTNYVRTIVSDLKGIEVRVYTLDVRFKININFVLCYVITLKRLIKNKMFKLG